MNPTESSPTYMFIFRSPADGPDPTPEQMQQNFQKVVAWVNAMRAKGQYLGGNPLEDAPAKVVRGPAQVSDGPYAEAKEVIGGFMMIRAKDFAEAVAIAQTCPFTVGGGVVVEVRQVQPFDV